MTNNKDNNSKNGGGGERVDLIDTIKHPKQKEFLLAFRETGSVKKTSQITGINRSNHYVWIHTYPSYKRAFNRERLTVSLIIEEGMVERLANGWDEPVYQGGELVGHKKKFDHQTAMRYLEATNPEVFMPKKEIEVTHPEGTNITPSDEVVAMDEMVPREGDEEGAGNEQGG